MSVLHRTRNWLYGEDHTLEGAITISGATTLSGGATLSGTNTISGPTTISGAVTQSSKVTVAGATVNRLILATSVMSLVEANHSGNVILCTSTNASSSRHCRVTVPLASAGTSGASYTIVSGYNAVPTSNGIYLIMTSKDKIGKQTSGKGLKSGVTSGAKWGASITIVNGGTNQWWVVRRDAAIGIATTKANANALWIST